MLATLIIVLPLVAAIVVWVAPLPREATAGLAVLAALAEVALWVVALLRFDFASPALQESAQQEWFDDLGVTYHVGFYGFSLWLAGLTVVLGAAAIGFGAWAGRDRPRAYYGLMLFLVGAVVGVFASQDLLLFYVFFEAMLIPDLRARRRLGRPAADLRHDHVRHLHDGRLAADARLDRRLRTVAGHVQPRRLGHERQRLGLSRLRRRVCREGAAAAVPRLDPGRLHRGAARGGRPVVGRRLEGRGVRLHLDRAAAFPGPRSTNGAR